MARCPKCSFALVLLSQRNKYKCAKCSGLYLANEIDNKEFRDWNKIEIILKRVSEIVGFEYWGNKN